MKISASTALGVVCVAIALASSTAPFPAKAYEWQLPKGFPEPLVPKDNPMTSEKVELGRHLFYDKRLSANEKQSCASCHRQERAFADDKPTSPGSTGAKSHRNAMGLVNIVYAGHLTWSNPNLKRLEAHALVPMFGADPIELGLHKDHRYLKRLEADRVYKQLFKSAFPDEAKAFTTQNVAKALACFQRSIISIDSPYDRYRYHGEDSAISKAAKRGEELFFSNKLRCFRCHGGFNFSSGSVTAQEPHRLTEFHNTGLYNVKGSTTYPKPNVGTYEHTKKKEDVGMFKAPSLRNIALTGPYMHDGSIATLEEVIDHYAAGGRTISTGPHKGIGRDNPNKSNLVQGFEISNEDRKALIAFLRSLTDTKITKDPRFSDPWQVAK